MLAAQVQQPLPGPERPESSRSRRTPLRDGRINMPVVNPVSADDAPHMRRVPKLAVRNKVSSDDSSSIDRPATSTTIAPSSADSEEAISPAASSNSSQRTQSVTFERRNSDSTTQRTISRDGESSVDMSSSKSKQSQQQQQPGKKAGGMLGFLTVKEPSTAAMEQFVKAEKQKAKQSGLRSGSQSTLASQKLPSHVPKVNSKWDGLPEAKKKSMDVPARPRMSTTSARAPQVIVTGGSYGNPATRKPRISMSGSSVRSHSHFAPIPAMSPLEETNSSQPEHFNNYDFSNPRNSALHPQQIYEKDGSAAPTPELEGDDTPQYYELDAGADGEYSQTPRTGHSPVTPEDVPTLLGIHYPEMASPEQLRANSPQPASSPITSEPDTVAGAESTDMGQPLSKSLRKPVKNFSRILSRRPRSTAEDHRLGSLPRPSPTTDSSGNNAALTSPNLASPTGRTDPFLTDTYAITSRHTGALPADTVAGASSPAPAHHQSRAPPPFAQETIPEDPHEDSASTTTTTTTSTSTSHPPANPNRRSSFLLIPQITTSNSSSSSNSTHSRPRTAASDESTTTAAAAAAAGHGITPTQQAEIDAAIDAAASLEPIARSNSDASLAPSAMSERWGWCSKDRLGLGGRVKRRGGRAPWEL